SMSDRVNYRIYTRFLKEKELQTAVMQMVKDNVPKASSKEKTDQDPDFASLLKQSIKDGEAQNQGNPFYMDNSSYKWKVRPFMKKKKNQSLNGSYSTSPEYDDLDRKSTRLNSSHVSISYAVFCLKKKKKIEFRIERH